MAGTCTGGGGGGDTGGGGGGPVAPAAPRVLVGADIDEAPHCSTGSVAGDAGSFPGSGGGGGAGGAGGAGGGGAGGANGAPGMTNGRCIVSCSRSESVSGSVGGLNVLRDPYPRGLVSVPNLCTVGGPFSHDGDNNVACRDSQATKWPLFRNRSLRLVWEMAMDMPPLWTFDERAWNMAKGSPIQAQGISVEHTYVNPHVNWFSRNFRETMK